MGSEIAKTNKKKDLPSLVLLSFYELWLSNKYKEVLKKEEEEAEEDKKKKRKREKKKEEGKERKEKPRSKRPFC